MTDLEKYLQWVNTPRMSKPNMVGADLTDEDLSGLDFSRFNLCCARFDGSNLDGASFRSSKLQRTSFTECNLNAVDFTKANLTSSNFSRANLSRVILLDAKIENLIGDGKIIRTMQLPPYIVTIVDDWVQVGCAGRRAYKWLDSTPEAVNRLAQRYETWEPEYFNLIRDFYTAQVKQ